MTATQAPPSGDYVPPGPGRTKRLTRGRKALIGFFVVAAAGAAAGGGTFASFTASTDNAADADAFATGEFELTNTVLEGGENTTECVSSAAASGLNAHLDCAMLFDGQTFADDGTLKTLVRLVNTGDQDGELVTYAPGGCTFDNTNSQVDLCDDILLEVQEVFATGGGRGTGSAVPTIAGHATHNDCVFGASSNKVDDTNGACSAGDDLAAFAEFSEGPIVIDDVLPFDGATVANNDVRYFLVEATLAADPAICDSGAEVTAGFNSDGVGCNNSANNGNAAFTIRWQLQSA